MTESVNDGGDTTPHITDQQPQVCSSHQKSMLCLGSGSADTEYRAAGCPDYRYCTQGFWQRLQVIFTESHQCMYHSIIQMIILLKYINICKSAIFYGHNFFQLQMEKPVVRMRKKKNWTRVRMRKSQWLPRYY